jgi:hypothetical protein
MPSIQQFSVKDHPYPLHIVSTAARFPVIFGVLGILQMAAEGALQLFAPEILLQSQLPGWETREG